MDVCPGRKFSGTIAQSDRDIVLKIIALLQPCEITAGIRIALERCHKLMALSP
jgi:hypothetical protein